MLTAADHLWLDGDVRTAERLDRLAGMALCLRHLANDIIADAEALVQAFGPTGKAPHAMLRMHAEQLVALARNYERQAEQEEAAL